jgi:GT2 family glycosyltransferase
LFFGVVIESQTGLVFRISIITIFLNSVRNQVIRPPEAVLSLYPLGKAEAPGPSSVMVRRPVIESVGGLEESFTGMYEDQAFLTKVYLRTPVYLSDRIWFTYRQHDSSSLAENIKAGRYDSIRQQFLAWLARYLTEIGIVEPQVWRKLRLANWPYRHPRIIWLFSRLQRVSSPRRIWLGIKRRCSWLRGFALP